jgi:hypothetical protein
MLVCCCTDALMRWCTDARMQVSVVRSAARHESPAAAVAVALSAHAPLSAPAGLRPHRADSDGAPGSARGPGADAAAGHAAAAAGAGTGDDAAAVWSRLDMGEAGRRRRVARMATLLQCAWRSSAARRDRARRRRERADARASPDAAGRRPASVSPSGAGGELSKSAVKGEVGGPREVARDLPQLPPPYDPAAAAAVRPPPSPLSLSSCGAAVSHHGAPPAAPAAAASDWSVSGGGWESFADGGGGDRWLGPHGAARGMDPR